MNIPKETQEKIQQLQLLEQNLQAFAQQRQGFQTQLVEVESAVKELKTAEETYKIVGSIMVASKKADLQKDLKESQEKIELRLKTLESQESKLREKAQTLQKEVMEKMQKND